MTMPQAGSAPRSPIRGRYQGSPGSTTRAAVQTTATTAPPTAARHHGRSAGMRVWPWKPANRHTTHSHSGITWASTSAGPIQDLSWAMVLTSAIRQDSHERGLAGEVPPALYQCGEGGQD